MKNLTFVFFLLFPLFSFSYLMPAPEETRVPLRSVDTRPIEGVQDCADCLKAVKSGANKGDLELIKWHENKIFGGNQESNSSDSVDGE